MTCVHTVRCQQEMMPSLSVAPTTSKPGPCLGCWHHATLSPGHSFMQQLISTLLTLPSEAPMHVRTRPKLHSVAMNATMPDTQLI